MNYTIRPARTADAQAVHDIYDYYVKNTNATFNVETAPVEHYVHKIQESPYPFFVAEEEDRVKGFAYGEGVRPHDAYIWDVELTIYLSPDAERRTGMGKALYQQLLDTLTEEGFYNVYGVITEGNEASLHFHKAFGFDKVADFPKMGYKNGAWHGVVWMHKALRPFGKAPLLPTPFRTARSKR